MDKFPNIHKSKRTENDKIKDFKYKHPGRKLANKNETSENPDEGFEREIGY
jgi:hypothetical protein